MNIISRRTFLRLAAAAGTLGALSATGCASSAASTNSAASTPPSTELQACFFLMSDVHISSGSDAATIRFRQALADINALEPKVDAIVVNGDLSDTGYTEEHEIFKQVVDESAFDLDKDFVISMGNHDYWYADDASNTEMTQKQKDDFVAFYKLPGLYYDTTVAGQHVVVLGPYLFNPVHNWVHFDMTITQLNWLDELLAADAAKGVHTYVVCHEPLVDTVPGSEAGSWGSQNSFVDPDKIYAVVSKYPLCIFLTGHTHVFPGVEASDPNRPIFANDGSCARSYRPGTGERGSWGLRMLVYGDHLEFGIRDFEEHHWEGDPIIVPFTR